MHGARAYHRAAGWTSAAVGRRFEFRRPRRRWPNGQPQRDRPRPPWLPLILLIAIATAGLFLFEQPNGAVGSDDGQEITGLVRVGDGDSIDIGTTRIRFHGIDAVELAQHCKDATGADYACGE